MIGLLPKIGACAQIIPSPVLGGAMLVMFGMVTIQGIRMLSRVNFENEHNLLIAGLSIATGVGFNNTTLFQGLPSTLSMFLNNGIVMATLVAIILNMIFNHKDINK